MSTGVTMMARISQRVVLADGEEYDGVYALGYLTRSRQSSNLAIRIEGSGFLLREIAPDGRVLHEAVIPGHWQPGMEFFFERPEPEEENDIWDYGDDEE